MTPDGPIADDFYAELESMADDELAAVLQEADEHDLRLQSDWDCRSSDPPSHFLEVTFLGALGCRLGMLSGGAGGLLVKMGETTLLVDPGPGALDRLVALRSTGAFSFANLDGILCSHLHPDHTANLLPCIEGMLAAGARRPRHVVCNTTVAERYRALSPYHFREVELTALRAGDVTEVGAVTATATPTLHVEEAGREHTGIGFLLSAGDDAVWISGDTTLYGDLVSFLQSHAARAPIAIANADASDVARTPGRAERCHLLTRDIPEVCRALRPPVFVVQHYDEAYSSLRYRAAQAMYAQRTVDREAPGTLVLFAADGLRLAFDRGTMQSAEADLPGDEGRAAVSYARRMHERRRTPAPVR